MNSEEVIFDYQRSSHTGLDETVYAAGKSVGQIAYIANAAGARGARLLITRLALEQFQALPHLLRNRLDYCAISSTARLGPVAPVSRAPRIALLAAGTSDIPVAREAERTLRYYGEDIALFADIGVAGLWRLMDRIDAIRTYPVLVVVAGMDAALPTVVAGLTHSALIAVPTSVGYGVATGGHAALNAILASCSPGISVVNIDNGFGAACAALRIVHMMDRAVAQVAIAPGKASLLSEES